MKNQTETLSANDILSDNQIVESTVEAIGRCHNSLIGYQSATDVAVHAIATEQVRALLETLEDNGIFEPRTVVEAAISYYTMEIIATFTAEHKEEAVEKLKESVELAIAEYGLI